MELVRLLYKHKNNDVFNEFPRISDKFLKISDNFPEISEYSLKARTFPNIIRKVPNITEVARLRLPRKIRRRFRSYTNKLKYS